MPPNELSQSMAMSLPFASEIALARMRIASTAARTVIDEVRSATRRRRGLKAVADSAPAGAMASMRLLMSSHGQKSKGIMSGEYRGHGIVLICRRFFSATVLPLLMPVGSLSSASKYEAFTPRTRLSVSMMGPQLSRDLAIPLRMVLPQHDLAV